MVIAVIAVLAALLLPALRRASDSADTAVCRSNLRQLAVGFASYLSDYHAYPVWCMNHLDQPDPNFPTWWHQQLEPYMGAKWPVTNRLAVTEPPRSRVYRCPSYERIVYVSSLPYTYVPMPDAGSYGYNSFGTAPLHEQVALGLGGISMVRNPVFTYQYRAVRDTEVLAPSVMLSSMDSYFKLSFNTPQTWAVLGSSDLSDGLLWFANHGIPPTPMVPNDPLLWTATNKRHNGRWNALFCDGHVQTMTTRSLFDIHDPEVLRRWNRDNEPHPELLLP